MFVKRGYKCLLITGIYIIVIYYIWYLATDTETSPLTYPSTDSENEKNKPQNFFISSLLFQFY